MAQLGDVVRIVWMVFGKDKLTTKEVEFRLAELFDYHCPDDFAKTMTKLKQAGLVKGVCNGRVLCTSYQHCG